MLSANLVLIILLWKNRKISVHIYWSVKSFGNCAAFTRSSISITGNQSVSLRSFALFRSAVPVVPQKGGTPFHSPLVSIASASPEKRAGRHYASSPSSSHALFLRSAGLLHPQYSFISLRSAGYTSLHSAVFVSVAPGFFAVAPSHSHRCWLRFLRLHQKFYFSEDLFLHPIS